jgi:hypothetical protein
MRERLHQESSSLRPAPVHSFPSRLQRKCAHGCAGKAAPCAECSRRHFSQPSLSAPPSLAAPHPVPHRSSSGTQVDDGAPQSWAFNQVNVLPPTATRSGADVDDPTGKAKDVKAGPNPAPPDACPGGVKTVTVDFVSLRGSSRDPNTDLALANSIFAPCCVQFSMASGRTATPQKSDAWLGGDTTLERSTGCGSGVTAEELNLFNGATATYGLTSRIRAFYVEKSHPADRGRSRPPACTTGVAAPIIDMVMVTNAGGTRTLAHEFGHILLNPGTHAMPADNLLHPTNTATGNNLTAAQCATIFANA